MFLPIQVWLTYTWNCSIYDRPIFPPPPPPPPPRVPDRCGTVSCVVDQTNIPVGYWQILFAKSGKSGRYDGRTPDRAEIFTGHRGDRQPERYHIEKL